MMRKAITRVIDDETGREMPPFDKPMMLPVLSQPELWALLKALDELGYWFGCKQQLASMDIVADLFCRLRDEVEWPDEIKGTYNDLAQRIGLKAGQEIVNIDGFSTGEVGSA
jgi:hypothetical protein